MGNEARQRRFEMATIEDIRKGKYRDTRRYMHDMCVLADKNGKQFPMDKFLVRMGLAIFDDCTVVRPYIKYQDLVRFQKPD